MPNKQMLNPLYIPVTPSLLYIFLAQSNIPVNYLWSLPLPMSTPSLVLAKSKGYTKNIVMQPAIPPAIILFNTIYYFESDD